jgi:hypothetical protein
MGWATAARQRACIFVSCIDSLIVDMLNMIHYHSQSTDFHILVQSLKTDTYTHYFGQ